MEKIKVKSALLLIALWIFSLCFFSCGGEKIPMDFRDRAFRCEIEFSSGGETLRADVEVGQNKKLSMKITEPHRLSGLTFVYGSDGSTAEYKDMSIDTNAFEHILSYGYGLITTAELTEVRRTRLDGNEIIAAHVTEDGALKGEYEIFFCKDTYIPIQIRMGDKCVYIRNFEFLE